MTESKQILWIDDEIDLLRAHILYLAERGYNVTPVPNGPDAIALVKTNSYDVVLIDEIMPAMNGIEVLKALKSVRPGIPAVMITKNEAEELMEQAIGLQIEGFLTKPVNPSQILSALKGIIEKRQITAAQLTRRWTEGFTELSNTIQDDLDADGWRKLHINLCKWELELDGWGEMGLMSMLKDIRLEADRKFSRWIEQNYSGWIAASSGSRPVLSMDLVDKFLMPVLKESKPTIFLVVDCLRMDQWLTLEPMLADRFSIERDEYFSILPTATPYSRNAIFSGLTPVELERIHPDLWAKGDEDEASSNRYERQFLTALLERRGVRLKPEPKYVKVLEIEEGAEFERRLGEYTSQPLTSMVYNFVDILVHTRQSVEVLREMIPDEAAFRSVTSAWFKHSSLLRIIQGYANAGGTVVLTSDHGAIRGRRGSQVVGDRQTSSSLRYKYGRNLKYDAKHAIRIGEAEKWGLPRRGVSTEYLFAREDFFFVYPTNYHHYLDLYKDSFQHGGVSLDEMILPVVTLRSK
jgi:CheY-like chemotaxis protein